MYSRPRTEVQLVKIGDFGIAKVLSCTVAMARTQIGTPYYMSPEICRDEPYNAKSDVWSLGCLLYEMTALEVPFNGRDLSRLALSILRDPPPRLPAVHRESHTITSLIATALQKNPNLRPTVTEVCSSQPAMMREVSYWQHALKIDAKHQLADAGLWRDAPGDAASTNGHKRENSHVNSDTVVVSRRQSRRRVLPAPPQPDGARGSGNGGNHPPKDTAGDAQHARYVSGVKAPLVMQTSPPVLVSRDRRNLRANLDPPRDTPTRNGTRDESPPHATPNETEHRLSTPPWLRELEREDQAKMAQRQEQQHVFADSATSPRANTPTHLSVADQQQQHYQQYMYAQQLRAKEAVEQQQQAQFLYQQQQQQQHAQRAYQQQQQHETQLAYQQQQALFQLHSQNRYNPASSSPRPMQAHPPVTQHPDLSHLRSQHHVAPQDTLPFTPLVRGAHGANHPDSTRMYYEPLEGSSAAPSAAQEPGRYYPSQARGMELVSPAERLAAGVFVCACACVGVGIGVEVGVCLT